MKYQILEYELALETAHMVKAFMDAVMQEDDAEAATIGVLATALEIASGRNLKSLEEVFK